MKTSLLLSILMLAVVAGCQTRLAQKAPQQARVDYTIEPTEFEKTPALKVTVSFAANSSGTTTLVLPEKWASENDYYNDLRSIELLTPGAVIKSMPEPFLRSIESAPGVPLRVSYILLPGKSHGANPFRALITSEYFHVVGYNLVAFPDLRQELPIEVSMTWQKFPTGFAFANTYGAQQSLQEFSTTIGKLKDAIYVGGDFRIHKEEIDHSPVYIALRGKWAFTDGELVANIRKVIDAERDFWNDHDFPYFLITLIPNGKECCVNGGTGFTQSFATFLAADTKIDHHLMWIYAHELFHTWNGSKIGHQEPQPLVFWFSEGFTNYYARLLSLRARFMNLRQYVQDVNEVIYNYFYSPVKTASNARILKEFWTDAAIGKLPYQRGDLLALHWNWRLKTEASASLDLPMRDLFSEAQARGTLASSQALGRLISRYIKEGVSDEIARYVDAGEALVPEPGALGPCVTQETRKLGKFELGFDRDASLEKKRITGLKMNSPAYRAGLREGQQLLDRKIVNPPFATSRVKIRDAKGTRWVEFLASSADKIPMPLYSLDEEKLQKDPALCMGWFN